MKGAYSGPTQPDWGVPLLASDYAALTECWVTSECADAALLRRVSSEEGREIVGQKGKRDCAGQLLPYYLPGETHPHTYRIRRDNPDHTTDSSGKLKVQGKYLGAPGCTNRLYFPPNVSVDQLQTFNSDPGYGRRKKGTCPSTIGLFPVGKAPLYSDRSRRRLELARENRQNWAIIYLTNHMELAMPD